MTKTQPTQAVRIVTACAIACAATALIGLKEGYWALITAVVVTQADLNATLRAGRDRIFGTLIGAAAGALVIAAMGIVIFSAAILFWVAFVPLAVLTAVRPNLRLSCITLVVLVLVPGTSSWERPFARVVEILIGTLASLLVSAVSVQWRGDPPAMNPPASDPRASDPLGGPNGE